MTAESRPAPADPRPGARTECGWIDLVSPDDATVAAVAAETGFELPTRAQLEEVEVSSRLRSHGDTIFLSLPLVFRDENRVPRITPVGFVLSKDHLVTIRFEDLKAFASCRARVDANEIAHPSPVSTFVALLEAMVDRLADILEDVGANLDRVSDDVFGRDLDDRPGRRPKVQDLKLRRIMRRVGRARQLSSKVRATLLAIGRIVPFVETEAVEWLPPGAKPRLETVGHDVASLDEFEVHLSDKIQFLLDADLGLISIEQNDRFRILTVVSIVGIPPTLVASMYGMNFEHMPELKWAWGYPFGLTLIAISAIAPLVWFKVRGWL